MNKTLIALAVLAGFAGAAAAQSSVTLSGNVDAGIRRANSDTSMTGAGSSRNNITFSGVEDLGNGNSAFFTLNHRFNLQSGVQNGQNGVAASVTTGATADTAASFYRNAFVGLKNTKIGDIRLGRMLMPNQEINGNYDAFGTNTVGSVHIDGRSLNVATASLRSNSTVYVRTANFGGFVGHAAVAAQDGAGTQVGNKVKPQGFGAEFAFGPASVAATYDRNGNDLDTVGLYAKYNAGFAVLFAQYEKNDDITIATTDKPTDTRVSVSAQVPYGAFTFKAGYREMDISNVAGKAKKAGVGLEYALSKRTMIYSDFSKAGGAEVTSATARKEQFDIGVSHKF